MTSLHPMLQHMGPAAMVVAGTLLSMAVATLAVFLERLVVYARSRRASRRFAAEARTLLEHGDTETLASRCEAHPGHLARLLGAGSRAYLSALRKPSALSPVEATRREMQRKAEALDADLRRGMGVIASVGSIAPFVGLLGTVFGIISAFEGIAREGAGGLGSVSAGISEALYETALGLVVAIPAVLAYNWLTSQADALQRALDEARGEFLDALEARQQGTPRGS